jgi:hypothetical protein
MWECEQCSWKIIESMWKDLLELSYLCYRSHEMIIGVEIVDHWCRDS